MQVQLTEYVKMDDVIYKVNNECLVPEDRLVHDRHITFPVSSTIKILIHSLLLNLKRKTPLFNEN